MSKKEKYVYYKLKDDINYINISDEFVQKVLRYLYIEESDKNISNIIRRDIMSKCNKLIVIPYLYNEVYENSIDTDKLKVNLNKIEKNIKFSYVKKEIKKILSANIAYTTVDCLDGGNILSFRVYITYVDTFDTINMAYYIRYNNSVGVLYKIYGSDPNYPLGIVKFDKTSIRSKKLSNIEFSLKTDEISEKIISIYNNNKCVLSLSYYNENYFSSTMYDFKSSFINNTNDQKDIEIALCSKTDDILVSKYDVYNMTTNIRYFLKVPNKENFDYFGIIFLHIDSKYLTKTDINNNAGDKMICVYNSVVGYYENKEKILNYHDKFILNNESNYLQLKEEIENSKKSIDSSEIEIYTNSNTKETSIEEKCFIMNIAKSKFIEYLIPNISISVIAKMILLIKKYELSSLLMPSDNDNLEKYPEDNFNDLYTFLYSLLTKNKDNKEIYLLEKSDMDMVNNFKVDGEYYYYKIKKYLDLGEKENAILTLYKDISKNMYLIKCRAYYYFTLNDKKIDIIKEDIDPKKLIFLYKTSNIYNFHPISINHYLYLYEYTLQLLDDLKSKD